MNPDEVTKKAKPDADSIGFFLCLDLSETICFSKGLGIKKPMGEGVCALSMGFAFGIRNDLRMARSAIPLGVKKSRN